MDKLKEKLGRYRECYIVISEHAREQAVFRGISLTEIKENIINPNRLYFADRQKALLPGEMKFDCYFGYSKTRCHRYVLVVNSKCIVCTVMKINRRWQHMVEKYAKV